MSRIVITAIGARGDVVARGHLAQEDFAVDPLFARLPEDLVKRGAGIRQARIR